MKNNNYIFIIAMFCSLTVQGQDVLIANQLNFDLANYNTAALADSDAPYNLTFSSSLGNGFQNTGKFNFLAYGVVEKFGIGLGVKVNTRIYGFFKSNTGEILYAKKIKLKDGHALYGGLSMGLHQFSLNRNILNEYVNQEDPLLMANELEMRFTAGFGIVYMIKDRLKIGFSSPSMIKTKNEFYPSYVGNASYRFSIASELNLTAAAMVYGTNVSPLSFEGSMKVDYNDNIWFRMTGRTTKMLGMGVGARHKFMEIGYMYNLQLNQMDFDSYTDVNPSVHSVNVAFKFGELNHNVE